MFINPFDRLRQLPPAWANHVAFSGLGFFAALIALAFAVTFGAPLLAALLVAVVLVSWRLGLIYVGAVSAIGVAVAYVFMLRFGMPINHAAALAVLIVVGIKKADDHKREGESVAMCIGKVVVTMLWPVSLVAMQPLAGAFHRL